MAIDTLEMKAHGQHVPPEQEMDAPVDLGSPRPMVDQSQLQAMAPIPQSQGSADPDEQKYSTLGRMAQALMGNTTEYQPDPQTGQPVKVTRQRKPGEFWKSLVAGALLGGAMGAGSEDFASGAVKGGAGVVADQERKDEAGFQRAQAEFGNQQAVRQEKRQDRQMELQEEQARQNRIQFDANIAMNQLQQMRMHKELDLMDDTQIEHNNEVMRALMDSAKKAGGLPAAIMVDGKLKSTLTGEELMQAVTQDPTVLKGVSPDTKTRMFFSSTDKSELVWDGKQWTDAAGRAVDMSDKTTIQVLDVPRDTMNEKVATSRAQLNKIAGEQIIDPNGPAVMLSPSDLISISNSYGERKFKKDEQGLRLRQMNLEFLKTQKEIQRLEKNPDIDDATKFRISLLSQKVSSLDKAYDNIKDQFTPEAAAARTTIAKDLAEASNQIDALNDELANPKTPEQTARITASALRSSFPDKKAAFAFLDNGVRKGSMDAAEVLAVKKVLDTEPWYDAGAMVPLRTKPTPPPPPAAPGVTKYNPPKFDDPTMSNISMQ